MLKYLNRAFGSGKGAASTGIRQEWQEQGIVGGGGTHTDMDRSKAGNIGILGRRQVVPRWSNDPVRRHDGR